MSEKVSTSTARCVGVAEPCEDCEFGFEELIEMTDSR